MQATLTASRVEARDSINDLVDGPGGQCSGTSMMPNAAVNSLPSHGRQCLECLLPDGR